MTKTIGAVDDSRRSVRMPVTLVSWRLVVGVTSWLDGRGRFRNWLVRAA